MFRTLQTNWLKVFFLPNFVSSNYSATATSPFILKVKVTVIVSVSVVDMGKHLCRVPCSY